jgi:hypothetical protein
MVHRFAVQKLSELFGRVSRFVRGFKRRQVDAREIDAISLEGILDKVYLVTRQTTGDFLFAKLNRDAIVPRNGFLVVNSSKPDALRTGEDLHVTFFCGAGLQAGERVDSRRIDIRRNPETVSMMPARVLELCGRGRADGD